MPPDMPAAKLRPALPSTTTVPEERSLKVTFRRVQSERAETTRVLAVFCPRRTQVLDLRQCQTCEHCEGLCVDPTDRTVRVYHSVEAVVTLTETDDLNGEHLLPGFRLSIRDWFDRASRIKPTI